MDGYGGVWFYYFVEQGEIEYYLVNNRNPEGFLIPEMNKVDFFIIIHQYIEKEGFNPETFINCHKYKIQLQAIENEISNQCSVNLYV
jgi:hypothetical protein